MLFINISARIFHSIKGTNNHCRFYLRTGGLPGRFSSLGKKGKVSNVKALSGPGILQEEEIRLIKDSPRWTPAIKNGEKVKSYKKQTIGFRLEGSLYNN